MVCAGSILSSAIARADIPQVRHVVVVVQENRTPDNLFHALATLLPAADIATSGLNSKGQTIPLTAVSLADGYDPEHSHGAFKIQFDGGKLDGADRNRCTGVNGNPCPANAQFAYVDEAEAKPYVDIALHYGFASRMFQSNQGPSFPAHQFLISGTSETRSATGIFASDNPPKGTVGGCVAPPNSTIATVGPNGMKGTATPCFEHATLTDILDHPPPGARSGLAWRYYTPNMRGIWTAPNAIAHMCQASGRTCAGPAFRHGDIVFKPAQVLADINSGKLRPVSWVIPSAPESDHPTLNEGLGPSWVTSIVNAIGKSSYWPNTVILVVWDDWGGWYDHVAPPIDPNYGYYESGFRVPLLVVSAYTPPAYVSTVTHTFGSILHFIETAYNLPFIRPGDKVDARSDDLMDFFNFNQAPNAFTPVAAPVGADFFLNDKRPPSDPDDD